MRQLIDKLICGRQMRFGLCRLAHRAVYVAQSGVQTPQQESPSWRLGVLHGGLQQRASFPGVPHGGQGLGL